MRHSIFRKGSLGESIQTKVSFFSHKKMMSFKNAFPNLIVAGDAKTVVEAIKVIAIEELRE